MIRAVAILVVKDLRANLTNGFFLTVGIVTPLVLAVVFNAVFGGAASGRLEVPVGVVDEDRSALSAELDAVLGALDDDGLLALERLDAGTDPVAALDDGDLAAVVVPEGFGAATTGPGGAPALEVVGDPDSPTSVGVARSVVERFAQGTDRARTAAVAAAALGVAPPPPGTEAVELVDREAADRLDPAAQVGAAMASLFMLIVALLGVTSVLDERREGTLARLLAAPIPRASVIVAKLLVSVILGVVSALALVVALGVVLGADWGPALGVAACVVGFSLAATGFTVLVTGTARTAEAAQNLQGTVAVLLAILGGGLVPLPDGGVIGVLRRLTPHHWFLEGLQVGAAEASAAAALPAVGALVGFAVVLGAPGVVLAQRRLGT